ncbi:MAG TPA: type II CAAX endopeptidase family protein [Blastocatellia bacterium]|nr:type II CAAX endopeptidase family protein [Blastocatellia bacterium]HMX26728.1 type II CAAX endopeptidase family protein [Blastocatellia bacterium]HMY75521.1 type II CAAX endopeptidase family protein [Blastocatellia bacterium]HNG30029.1 type II CAAX endopeptidase family protein [Blastocatellia bacterium]
MTMREFAQQHPLAMFFLGAFAGAWLFMIPLALSAQHLLPPLPPALHYASAYGPMLSAFFVTWLTGGGEGLREFMGRMCKWRVGWRWLVISALSPLFLYALGAIAARTVEGEWPAFLQLGQPNFLPDLGLLGALLLWIFNSGLGEETGWRGFALPHLQRNHGALTATLILALFWSLWHIPAFFYLPSYRQVGLRVLPGFFVRSVLWRDCADLAL